MTHSGDSCVANLIRSAASWSVGSAPPMNRRLPRLPSTTTWYCDGELGLDDVARQLGRVDRRRGRAAAARAPSTACGRGRPTRRTPAAITEATKLVRLSRELRTSSSAVFGFSLPAWTSTLATPERAECGASARVSNVEMPDQCCEKQTIIADLTRGCKRRGQRGAATIHAPSPGGETDATRVGNAGRGERIRTSGLYVPNVALYQAKLHPVSKFLAVRSGVDSTRAGVLRSGRTIDGSNRQV